MSGVLYDAVDRSLFAPEERYVYRLPMYPIAALQRSAMCRMITQLATSVNSKVHYNSKAHIKRECKTVKKGRKEGKDGKVGWDFHPPVFQPCYFLTVSVALILNMSQF